MTYILINHPNQDPVCYPVDTEEEINEAQQALLDEGIESAAVWVTPSDEFSPDAYQNGQTLYASN